MGVLRFKTIPRAWAGGADQIGFEAGSVSAPAFAKYDDADTGIYFSAANTVDVAAGGVRAASFLTLASGENYLTLKPATAAGAVGTGVILAAAGAGTHISIAITPKGTADILLGGTAPAGSATRALVQIGTTVLSGGNAAGTWLGWNAATAYAGDHVTIQQNSVSLFRLTSVASGVNGVQITFAAASGVPVIAAAGSDANITLAIKGKATGGIVLDTGTGAPTGAATAALLRLGPTAIAGGNAAGTYLGWNAATAYAGDFLDFQQNSVLLVRITSVNAAVNGVQLTLAATTASPTLAAIGSDADILLTLKGKAAHGLNIDTGTGAPAAVATEALLLLGPTAISGGSASGTYVGWNAATTYAGNHVDIQQNSISLFKIASANAAVNGVGITPVVTTSSPIVAAIGSDANVLLTLKGKAAEGVKIDTGTGAPTASDATKALLLLGSTAIAAGDAQAAGGTYLGANALTAFAGDFLDFEQNGVRLFGLSSIASAVNGVEAQSAIATASPVIAAIGSDANVLLTLKGKAAEGVKIDTGTGAPTASDATKALLLLGSTAVAAGDATAAGGTYLGANALTAYAGDFVDLEQNGVRVFGISSVASAVNGVEVQTAATGGAAQIAAIGSDDNVHINLRSKATTASGGGQTVRINSMNFSWASGDIIGYQSKPAANATGTATVYGSQISPRFNHGVAGGALIGVQSNPILKGTAVAGGDLTGDVRAFEARLESEDAGVRIIDSAYGIRFMNQLRNTITATNGVYPICVDTHGSTLAWSGLAKLPADGNIAKYSAAHYATLGAIDGAIQVRVGTTLLWIPCYVSIAA